VSPRQYEVGARRREATEATRARIIGAARELLADPARPAFSIDAIAERADVARMTIYYQFKSKGKLLEALFDDFASRANMRDLRKAFQEPDVKRAVCILVDVFCRLWDSQSVLLRRLTAIAALDPEVDHALRERGDWRREALTTIVERLTKGRVKTDLVDVLHVLTSFETYDALIAAKRSSKQISALLQASAITLLSPFGKPG
jgi:AcrR family transcriptional regulator